MSLPHKVQIVEVGPRDGLQNEATPVSVAARVELIENLQRSGLNIIEAGSFVSPKWVPQMAGSAEVLQALGPVDGVRLPMLVPNAKGLELALAAGARDISVFLAASETFSLKNINCGIEPSISRIEPVIAEAIEQGLRVRGYVSCVAGCPYEGAVALDKVLAVSTALHDMGCYEISLGDTIGVGTPVQLRNIVASVAQRIGIENVAVHCHDTYGQALANVFACLELGVEVVDASVAGLGGCPYARGASGNLATEDLVFMLNGLGIESGVELEKLLVAGQAICAHLGRMPQSKVSQALHKE